MGTGRLGPPPAEPPDEQGWDLFCEVFVNTDLSAERLEYLIADLLDAAVQGRGFAKWVVGPHYVMKVLRNKRVLETARQTGDFVNWPYYIEIDAKAGQTKHMHIAVIARLLIGLWAQGMGAVAACDFEDELPRRGDNRSEAPGI